MKNNTQKILLALYPGRSTELLSKRVSYEALQLVVPELSDGGFRSLLFVLKKQGIVTTQKILGKSSVGITQYGSLLLEREFPALSSKWVDWDGKWECMVFLEPPSFDKHFRYLRTLILSEGAVAFSRGVYMAPGGFPESIIKECQLSYHKAVILFSVGSWKIATESTFIIEKYGLLDIVEAYSGISRDVSRLLKQQIYKKELINQSKKDMNLVYDRVLAVLKEDPGFCSFYFQEVPNIQKLLSDLYILLSELNYPN